MKLNVYLVVLLECLCLASGEIGLVGDTRSEREEMMRKFLKKKDGAIKLVGGTGNHEGNVEILHGGRWGAVCDDEWDSNEAKVVCQQLGFPGHVKATHSGYFGEARRKFWMDNVECTGKEPELIGCRFDGWGHSDCEASEAAGVVCKTPPTPLPAKNLTRTVVRPKHRLKTGHSLQMRLAGGRIHSEGRIEVRLNNVGPWGAICADGWSLLEANVACRVLGLGFASAALQTDYFTPPDATPKILLSGTECHGNETHLQDCLHHEVSSAEAHCSGNKRHVAGVMCEEKMADLVLDFKEIEQTAHLEDRPLFFLQCAMEENCLAAQAYEIQKTDYNWHQATRRLLKFTASVRNDGTAAFRSHIPKEQWEWHMCHMHYHSMEVFATFDVIDGSGKKIAEGHKASFCLEDNQCDEGIKATYFCANYGDQGISVNCTDIYRYSIDCQWVDISEIDYGTYTLKISVNPEFKVAEMSFDNNAATCTFLYTESFGRVYDCKMGRP
ncbi:lysyl oxidase homolog 2B [Phlebotomus argentipes]|uniref:lysyl oxidase homolog 2B n=1 Tax=Phlebotomus argentipes TaxID=94469 RepID=UPI0028931489|nr:lysyl oxidase homolog 2B [Phlebotomus argentipes]